MSSDVAAYDAWRKGSPSTHWVGLDENGLGPRLGPLVVSAVALELSLERSRPQWMRLGRKLGIDDSKQRGSFGHMRRLESFALGLLARLGRYPQDFSQLLGALHTDVERPCPEHGAWCWAVPVSLPCFGGNAAEGAIVLDALEAQGATLRGAQSHALCAAELNRLRAAGCNRYRADLDGMCTLLRQIRLSGACIDAGLVGGIRDYLPQLRGHFTDAVEEERSRGLSRYSVAGAQLSFALKSDQHALPVAMASMLGKYLREVWMRALNLALMAHGLSQAPVSGYHDPKTRAVLIEAPRRRLRQLAAPDCLERA